MYTSGCRPVKSVLLSMLVKRLCLHDEYLKHTVLQTQNVAFDLQPSYTGTRIFFKINFNGATARSHTDITRILLFNTSFRDQRPPSAPVPQVSEMNFEPDVEPFEP